MVYINPLYQTIFMDSCALNPNQSESRATEKLFDYHYEGKIHLTLSESVKGETCHQKTPLDVKVDADYMVVASNQDMTSVENEEVKRKIWEILTGNGKPEKMKSDALHVFEAHRFSSYFVTADERILKHRSELENVCKATVVLPSELLSLIKEYDGS